MYNSPSSIFNKMLLSQIPINWSVDFIHSRNHVHQELCDYSSVVLPEYWVERVVGYQFQRASVPFLVLNVFPSSDVLTYVTSLAKKRILTEVGELKKIRVRFSEEGCSIPDF